MESTLREDKSPQKRFCRQHLATLATLMVDISHLLTAPGPRQGTVASEQSGMHSYVGTL